MNWPPYSSSPLWCWEVFQPPWSHQKTVHYNSSASNIFVQKMWARVIISDFCLKHQEVRVQNGILTQTACDAFSHKIAMQDTFPPYILEMSLFSSIHLSLHTLEFIAHLAGVAIATLFMQARKKAVFGVKCATVAKYDSGVFIPTIFLRTKGKVICIVFIEYYMDKMLYIGHFLEEFLYYA